jgi:hypothetical protein
MSMLDPTERRRQAQDLAAMWSRISRQHLSASQGCACGFGGVVLQASDFEIDIVEFLINDARKAGVSGVEPFVESVARRPGDRYSLTALFAGIADADSRASAEEVALMFALSRLRTSLSSIEAAHSRSRFSCD